MRIYLIDVNTGKGGVYPDNFPDLFPNLIPGEPGDCFDCVTIPDVEANKEPVPELELEPEPELEQTPRKKDSK